MTTIPKTANSYEERQQIINDGKCMLLGRHEGFLKCIQMGLVDRTNLDEEITKFLSEVKESWNELYAIQIVNA